VITKKITDNYGRPRQEYIDRLHAMNDDQLREECQSKIWLSAYANNNPRSDYHWQCTATYDECQDRGTPEIYAQEHKKLVAEVSRR